jgi:iron only hydrogenase large subunit-like protein
LQTQDDPIKMVVSFSHQAIASFAAKFSLKFQDAAEKLCAFFRLLGFDHVFDLTLARHLSLNESIREFVQHFETNRSVPTNQRTPFLCSVCPGFVCYVEKTHSQLVPMLSKVKSPQQVQGHLLRNVWCERNQIPANQVYHVTLMPCFDKKLEASRKEFLVDELKDVDCVITPLELEVMLDRENVKFDQLSRSPLDQFLKEQNQLQPNSEITNHIGSGSGGYAEHVYRSALSAVLGKNVTNQTELKYDFKRNKDFVEIIFESEGKPEVTVAIVNGFRNIQTIVQRQKRKMLHYDYIEVMACPTGCLNGGGLLRDVSFDDIHASYLDCESIPVNFADTIDSHLEMCTNLFTQERVALENALHTSFNVIPKMENMLHIAW